MRVEHTFGLVSSAGGVAERAGRVFIEAGPGVVAGFGRQQVFVAAQPGQVRLGRQVLAASQEHPFFHGGAHGGQALDQRQKGEVEEQQPVLGVVDDEHQLLGKQPRVDGVAHRPDAGHAVVQLKMPVGVPGQGTHPVAVFDAELQQRLGQLLAAAVGRSVGVAVDAALGQARHNFGIAVPFGGVLNKRSHAERLGHHQSLHRSRLKFTQCLGVLKRSVPQCFF